MKTKSRRFTQSPDHKAIISVCELLLTRLSNSTSKREKAVASVASNLLALASKSHDKNDFYTLMDSIGFIFYLHADDCCGVEAMAVTAICDCLQAA